MIDMLAASLGAAMLYPGLGQHLGGRKVRSGAGTICLQTLIGLMIGLSFGANALVHELTVPPAPREVSIVGARIYPSPDAAPIDDGVVIVRAGRIVRVGSRSEIPVPRAARLIDARVAVLTAGFWNSHVHLMTPALMNAAPGKAETLQSGLETMLTHWGFTTVFDLASSTDNVLVLRRRVNSGEIAGPMILSVGDPFVPKNGTPIYVRDFLKAHNCPTWRFPSRKRPRPALHSNSTAARTG